jgi:hypothetical protein
MKTVFKIFKHKKLVGSVWCVKHREGWCATLNNVEPNPEAFKDKTACGYYITMRLDEAKRLPTVKNAYCNSKCTL